MPKVKTTNDTNFTNEAHETHETARKKQVHPECILFVNARERSERGNQVILSGLRVIDISCLDLAE